MSGFGKFKGLFIEEDSKDYNPEELLKLQSEYFGIKSETKQNVSVDVGNLTNVEDIYEANQLADKSKSIFKVDEIKNVLPGDLPSEAKKASVLGMLQVSNLKIEDLLLDAENRIGTLNGALEKVLNETENIVSKSEAAIKEYELKIETLKEIITTRKKLQEDQESIVNSENEKINSIVKFIK